MSTGDKTHGDGTVLEGTSWDRFGGEANDCGIPYWRDLKRAV